MSVEVDASRIELPGAAPRIDGLVVRLLDLDPARFRAYRKLEREAHRAELANDAVARKAERRKWTAMIKGVERHMDQKYGAER